MTNAEIRSQEERIEELFAELPMAGPEFSIAIPSDRKVIDENRVRPSELYVVGRRIAQIEALALELQVQVEMEERCLFKERKRPFVRH